MHAAELDATSPSLLLLDEGVIVRVHERVAVGEQLADHRLAWWDVARLEASAEHAAVREPVRIDLVQLEKNE